MPSLRHRARKGSVFKPDAKFRILFAGNMGLAQALDVVLDAAVLLSTAAPQIEFVFLGGGLEVNNLKQLAQKLELQNVVFCLLCQWPRSVLI